MGSIQSGINQLIGLGALGAGVYSRSVSGKANAATRQANIYESAQNQYSNMLSNPNAFTGTPEQQELKRKGTHKLYTEARDSAIESRLRALDMKPTQERINAYLNSYAAQQQELKNEEAESPLSKAAMTARTAMARMRQIGMDQIEQNKTRRNFMDYLRNQPSSIGNVGDLPPEVQKQIAKSYNPAQRKKLMDQEDEKKKEKRDGRKI